MAKTAPTTIPSTLRAKVMARAWEMFRQSYGYPRVPFRSLGKSCFASMLKAAWHEARETVRLASYGAENLKRWIVEFSQPAHAVGLSTSYALSNEAMRERLERRRFYQMALAVAEAS